MKTFVGDDIRKRIYKIWFYLQNLWQKRKLRSFI